MREKPLGEGFCNGRRSRFRLVAAAQIVSGYSLGEQVSPNVGFLQSGFRRAAFAYRLVGNLAVRQTYLDRPTVSHAPQTRPDFIRNLALP